MYVGGGGGGVKRPLPLNVLFLIIHSLDIAYQCKYVYKAKKNYYRPICRTTIERLLMTPILILRIQMRKIVLKLLKELYKFLVQRNPSPPVSDKLEASSVHKTNKQSSVSTPTTTSAPSTTATASSTTVTSSTTTVSQDEKSESTTTATTSSSTDTATVATKTPVVSKFLPPFI